MKSSSLLLAEAATEKILGIFAGMPPLQNAQTAAGLPLSCRLSTKRRDGA